MSEQSTPPRNRSRWPWWLGAIGIVVVGILVGFGLQNVWLGLTLGIVVAVGWLIAYESWRGRNVGVNDPDHGIEL